MVKLDFRFASVILVVVSALVLGCGEPEVAKADVEQGAMKQLTATVGKQAPPITCPGNLKAKTGTKMVCSMPLDGKTYDVNVTVNEVDGTNVKYDVAVGEKPRE